MVLGKIIINRRHQSKHLVIRYPKMSDAAMLQEFINTISKEKTFISFQGEQMSLKEEKMWLKERLGKIKNNLGLQLLVFCNGKLCGNAGIEMKPRAEKHVGTFGITIAAGHRGKGIGALLMKTILKEAKKILDLKIIILSVLANNPIAIKLYKKIGFKKFGKLPKGVKHRKKLVDSIYMYKNI